jgi:hypothetical protein
MKWSISILLVLISSGFARATSINTYALVINGLNKDPEDRLVKDRAVESLKQYLQTSAKVDPAHSAALAAEDASADNIAKAVSAFAPTIGPQDRFLLYYTGQANAVTGKLRLNLAGPDVTQENVAGWLNRIRAKSQLVVLDCPCAGLAAKALAARGRIVLCATTETQVYSTRFGVHFVRALNQPDSDANSDGQVSILEAFTAAAREIEKWYQNREVFPTETPCLEDNGDGVPSERPWRHAVEAVDGLAAAQCFLAEN